MPIKKQKKKKVQVPGQGWNNVKSVKRDRLIKERKKKNLTQGQLAALIHVSTATISHLENGRMKPSFEIALSLQEVFKVSFEILFPDL